MACLTRAVETQIEALRCLIYEFRPARATARARFSSPKFTKMHLFIPPIILQPFNKNL